MLSIRPALAALATIALLASTPAAQCPVPDNLDGGPCCATAQPFVPVPLGFKQDSLGICWRGCDVESLTPYRAVFKDLSSLGVLPECGEGLVYLRLRVPAGPVHWQGVLRLQYSRTWLETDPAGDRYQVWRFLANGDLRPDPSLASPCPLPPCVPATNGRARFTGYVDYAQKCGATASPFVQAWMLSHVCDMIDHAPGFPRAGAFHPDRSYTFVGPSAGFVPGLVPAIAVGGGSLDAVRRRNLPVPGTVLTCEFEEPASHALTPLTDLCLCGAAGDPNQWLVSSLSLVSACGTVMTTPGGPYLPGYLSMAIGTWTDPTTYPGVEQLRWNTGGYDRDNPCTGITDQEVYFGVTTLGGWVAQQMLAVGPGALLPLTFVDQSSSRRDGGAHSTLLNVPFVSDHFLNLNF